METLIELGDDFVGEDLLGFEAIGTAEVVFELGDDLIDHADRDAEATKPIKSRVVADRGHGATGICNDIHVVAEANGVPGGPEQTDVSGQSGQDEVGSARGLESGDEFRLVETA